MTTYPTSVVQNYAPPKCPQDLRPVPESNWKMFAPLAHATAGLGMIEGVTEAAVMTDATEGMYEQFIYLDPDSDIRARLVTGIARDGHGVMAIMEYPSDIYDRDSVPLPFIDKYTAGEPHALRVQRINSTLGQLYWDATSTDSGTTSKGSKG
jgi:hypothetical protein